MNHLNDFISGFQSYLNEQCCLHDVQSVKRKRIFNTKLLLASVITLVTERKTSSYRLISSIFEFQNIAFGNINLKRFSASAFCDARKKLSPYLFVDLSQWVYRFVSQHCTKPKWFGRKIFSIDASEIILPKELEADGFYSKKGHYYPRGMLTTLFDLQLSIPYDCMVSQHTSERRDAINLLPSIPEDSILIGDRGYFSYEFIHKCEESKISVILRVAKSNAPVEIADCFRDEDIDETITITPSSKTFRKMARRGSGAKSYTVRVISYSIGKVRYVLLTTIFDDEISAKNIADLYKSRWDIESHFKLVKSQMQMEAFHSKSVQGVLQEIFAIFLVASLSGASIALLVGPKTKKAQRAEYSQTIAVGSISRILVAVFHATASHLLEWIVVLIRSIEKAGYKFRPNRNYRREGHRDASRWTLVPTGVRG